MPPDPSSRAAISVVVPFRDSEAYIADCLTSLLGQRSIEGEVEIILVDNGSTDRSADIVDRFDGVTLLTEPRPGVYIARNTGIQVARAPVIAFTDADCVADADWLQSVQTALRSPSTAIVVGHCRYPPSASRALRLLGRYENTKTAYVMSRCAPAYRYAYANNMAVRRSVFDELGRFKEWKRAGDSELVHRLLAARSDLEVTYNAAMRITHLEFRGARARVDRLSLYRGTNQQISTFRELSVTQRLSVLAWMLSEFVGSRWGETL